jgi:TonB-linked SusC/RagA family outer membrane protein
MKHLLPDCPTTRRYWIAGLLSLILLGPLPLPAQMLAQSTSPPVTPRPSQTYRLTTLIGQLKNRFRVNILFEEKALRNLSVPSSAAQPKATLEASLTALLEPLGLRYRKVKNNYVILSETAERKTQSDVGPSGEASNRAASAPLAPEPGGNPEERGGVPTPAPAEISISGTVTDESGNGLTGVSVSLKGTPRGTTTNARGGYTLAVPDQNATLVFSFVGYLPQEVVVGSRTVINVALAVENKTLNEVVVVGYGEQQKRDVTGAVASVSSKQLRNVPAPGFDQALAGQVAGLQVQQTTGAPGGNINVRIRGSGSIGAGNEPLYVVDGFPGVTNLNAISPNDIESIEVLKDASAAAIYGSRGANGVVIITTKRGRTGKATFQLDAYAGVQGVLNKVRMMNATQFAEHHILSRNNAYADVGGNIDLTAFKNSRRPLNYQLFPGFIESDSSGRLNPNLGEGTDWQDAIFRLAPVQNVQLTANGGTEKVRYAVSAGFYNQDGVIIESGFKRYSLRLNVDADLSSRVKLGINLAPSYAQRRIVNSDDTWSQQGIVQTALSISPHLPVDNPDGTRTVGQFNLVGLSNMQNPVAIAELYKLGSGDFTTTGNIYLDIQPAKNFVFRTALGTNVVASAFNSYYPSTLGRTGAPPPSVARGEARSSLLLNWVNSNTLTYTRTLGQRHNLSVLLGNETQKQRIEDTFVRGEKYSSDAAQSIGAAGQITAGSGGASEWALLSYFGRVTYDYARKYLMTVNVRRDGSSRFGPSYKWGTFPSASVGWQVMEEPFMQALQPTLGTLKLRASYGLGGNNNIGNYAWQSLLADNNYILGGGVGELVTGLAPGGLPNPDLRWETSRQSDVGLDAGLFDGRLQLTVDYYDKLTRDLLLNVNVPRLSGYNQALTNIGKVRNWGWEFSLSSQNLTGRSTGQSGGLAWTTNLNLAFNRNNVLALGPSGDAIIRGTSQIADSHITQVGQPLGNFYGYQIVGVFNTQEEINTYPKWAAGTITRPGDYKYLDANGDGVLNASDRVVLGNAFPKLIYGLTNTLTFRGLELSVLIQGSEGVSVLNGTRRFNSAQNSAQNQLAEVGEGRWVSATQPGSGYSRPWSGVGVNNNNVNMNSKWLEDGSFLRVRTVSLSYQLPGDLTKRLALRSLRVYAAVQNALMLTNYRGYNPEVSFSADAVLNPGVDYGTYPIPRTFTFGLTADF